MQQLEEWERGMTGAAGDDIVRCDELAIEAWGEPCKDRNSGLMAFAYLWRRFGPPWSGSDDHKDLVAYYLTTNDPDVFLVIRASGSALWLGASYLAKPHIREEANRPSIEYERKLEEWWWSQHPELEALEDTEENRNKVADLWWKERLEGGMCDKAVTAIGDIPPRSNPKEWRTAGGVIQRVNTALFDAMQELLKPVYVRDIAINIFGRCDDSDEPAEQSVYAGYGVPKEAMDSMLEPSQV